MLPAANAVLSALRNVAAVRRPRQDRPSDESFAASTSSAPSGPSSAAPPLSPASSARADGPPPPPVSTSFDAEPEPFVVDRGEVNALASRLREGIGSSGGAVGVTDLMRGGAGEVLSSLVRDRYESYVRSLRENSPRILLVGDSGTGKSNCVNICFGFHPDAGGAGVHESGRPCTQSFAEYGPTSFSPVRIIDSRGVEKMSVEKQMEELREFITEAGREKDVLKHVHLCWYFCGERWQEADRFVVEELRKLVGVIICVSKRDARSAQGVENLRKAVEEDLGRGVFIAEFGDPRGTRNYIVDSCGLDGHGEEDIEVNLRTKTWTCVKEVGVSETGDPLLCRRHGSDAPFGHRSLVHASIDLLPKICHQSFLTAQRCDMRAKHVRAAAVIGSFVAAAIGVGAVPVPFADMPILLAMEASMAASLIAVYGVPFSSFGADQLIAIHSGVVGVGGAIGYFTAQVLKGIPVLNIAGASIDMMIAGTAVASLGVAMSVVLTRAISTDMLDTSGNVRRMVGMVASQANVGSAVQAIARGGTAASGQDALVGMIEAGAREDGGQANESSQRVRTAQGSSSRAPVFAVDT